MKYLSDEQVNELRVNGGSLINLAVDELLDMRKKYQLILETLRENVVKLDVVSREVKRLQELMR